MLLYCQHIVPLPSLNSILYVIFQRIVDFISNMLNLSITINFNNFNVQCLECLNKSLKNASISFTTSFQSLYFLCNFILKFWKILLFFLSRRVPLLSCLLCSNSLLFKLLSFLGSDFLYLIFQIFLNQFLIKISSQPFVFLSFKNVNNFRQSSCFSQKFHQIC